MERSSSPNISNEQSPQDSSPPSSPRSDEAAREEGEIVVKKKTRKKRKADQEATTKKTKKRSKQEKTREEKKARKQPRRVGASSSGGYNEQLSAAQLAANEQMRKALEEDQYSALGSVVDTDSDDDDYQFRARGGSRLDRAALISAMRKRLWMERMSGSGTAALVSNNNNNANSTLTTTTGTVDGATSTATSVDGADHDGRSRKKKKKRSRGKEEEATGTMVEQDNAVEEKGETMGFDDGLDDNERDEGSIFGQTTGSSNATWVECDKCKKWRRLRGVVDEKKLPSKWYCSMNKNDPERARCSAPEEEYETPNTPESAADARTRKHLRVWVRRLESNENFEARQPTMTRGKKRSAIASSKEPYEWIRCCNPSCGKWRALLRFMDAKQHIIDRTNNGEWYCVMNTWDEKNASCAAPQENLPAVGCPSWVMQDNN